MPQETGQPPWLQDAPTPIRWAPLNLQLYFQFILEKQQALQGKNKKTKNQPTKNLKKKKKKSFQFKAHSCEKDML